MTSNTQLCSNFGCHIVEEKYHELGAGDGAALEREEDVGALVRHAPPHLEQSREGARQRDWILL